MDSADSASSKHSDLDLHCPQKLLVSSTVWKELKMINCSFPVLKD